MRSDKLPPVAQSSSTFQTTQAYHETNHGTKISPIENRKQETYYLIIRKRYYLHK